MRFFLVLLFFFPVLLFAQKRDALSAESVIQVIKDSTNFAWSNETVDRFIVGDPTLEVTGIATTFSATMDVLKKATISGLNLIITHEPTFYNHTDDQTPLETDNVQETKKKFIEDNNLIIWRFHDHWHRMNPDGIMTGMIRYLGWQESQVGNDTGFFEFEKTTLREFGKKVQGFSSSPIRIIGNPSMSFSKVAAVWGAAGSSTQIEVLQRPDVEVLIVGESREWETVEYVRDASLMGRTKALIIMGHANSEEQGMKYCAEWIKGFVDSVPIEFIAAGDPFWAPGQ